MSNFLNPSKRFILRIIKMSISSDITTFRTTVKSCKKFVALTGAGISAEAGIPTFRGSGGFWRQYKATVGYGRLYLEQLLFYFYFRI